MRHDKRKHPQSRRSEGGPWSSLAAKAIRSEPCQVGSRGSETGTSGLDTGPLRGWFLADLEDITQPFTCRQVTTRTIFQIITNNHIKGVNTMARIKVTGYLNTEDMQADHIDLENKMGVSSDGFDYYCMEMMNAGLDDTDFELET